jgi:dihydrofolate synthase/folylpolyglutamate synthase
MPGNHQVENAALAVAAWETMAADIGLSATDDAIRWGLETASLPGRFERVEVDGRTWILDGAHTPVSASALAETLLAEFGRPVGVIAGLLRDKHPTPFFAALAPAIAGLIVTAPHNPRAIPAEELILTVDAGNSQTIAREDLETALETARASFPTGLPIVITGSFTLVAEARERFGLAFSDR